MDEKFTQVFGSVWMRFLVSSNGYVDIDVNDGVGTLTEFMGLAASTDGNHLYKESGKVVTAQIADWIKTVE